MHDYAALKNSHGSHVSQTIDTPILIFDYFELGDGFAALAVILVFGVIFYSWAPMCLLLCLVLGILPVVRRRNEKGILLHWPYRWLNVSLPGLINPRGRRTYSD